jgi:hypothetical protein
MTPNVAWGVVLGSGVALEAYALRYGQQGDTLSERTRAWWRVDTRPGRIAFTACWAGFSTWYLLHILKPQE